MPLFCESKTPATQRGKLTAAYAALAVQLQEAAEELSNGDVAQRLRAAIADYGRDGNGWVYYLDHYGDAEAGEVVYCKSGDTFICPYSIDAAGAAAEATLDTDSARQVIPRTVYEDAPDEADGYAAMEEAGLYTKGGAPFCERFVSKAERDAADAGDFAGKGKSFPILKRGDVMAAVRSMGRAGADNHDAATLKKRITAIAKRKGWKDELPKAWQDSKESAKAKETALALCESATTLETIRLAEAARIDYPVKLIAPGAGSSAFYTPEVLKRDGPRVFAAGTHMYLNHPTAAEESARPEGDVKNLAAVLTEAATYQENGKAGPGLYARMKVFADHAQLVEDKAPHVGLSIRAHGKALIENGAVVRRDGKPVIASLDEADSVDVVTRAGAGGMILTESARDAGNHQEQNMEQKEVQQLIEAATAPLRERALRGDASLFAARAMETSALPAVSRSRVIESVMRSPIPLKDGALDTDAFGKQLAEAAKSEAEYVATITGAGTIRPTAANPSGYVQLDTYGIIAPGDAGTGTLTMRCA